MEEQVFNDFKLLHAIWSFSSQEAILTSSPTIKHIDTSHEVSRKSHSESIQSLKRLNDHQESNRPSSSSSPSAPSTPSTSASFEQTFIKDMQTSLALKNRHKRRVANSTRVSELAKSHTQKEKVGRWMTLEEEVECSFKPSRSAEATQAMMNPSCGYDFLDRLEQGSDGDFLSRMGKGEEVRRRELDRQRGLVDYEARQDKKQCPRGEGKQSYDEWKDKRKICPRCKVAYRAPNKWSRDHWDQRMSDMEEKSRRRREALFKHLEEEEMGLSDPEMMKIKKKSQARLHKKNMKQKILHESLTQSQHEQFDSLMGP